MNFIFEWQNKTILHQAVYGQVYNDMKNYADLGGWYPPRPGHPPTQPPFTM